MNRGPRNQNRAAILVSVSGTLIALAGLVPPVITGETNEWFWGLLIASVAALALGASLAASTRFYLWLWRLLFGDPVILIRRAEDSEIDAICALANQAFGHAVTSPSKARAIRGKYKDAFTVAVCKDRHGAEVIRGYFAAFPVNKSFVSKVLTFQLDIQGIDTKEVATKPQYGHAFYIGGIVGLGLRVRGELLGAMKFDHKKAAGTKSKTAYARAATPTGVNRLLKYDFEPVHQHATGVGCFYRKTFR